MAGNDRLGNSRYAVVSLQRGVVEREKKLEGCTIAYAPAAAPLLATCANDTELVAVDPATLQISWRRQLDGQVKLLSAGSDLLLQAAENMVAAVDLTGKLLWSTRIPSEGRLGVVEAHERVYAYESDPAVWALDRTTGKMLWSFHTDSSLYRVAPRADGALAVQTRDGEIVLDSATGRVIPDPAPEAAQNGAEAEWTNNGSVAWTLDQRLTFARHLTQLTLGDGVVYACSQSGVLHALDGATGKLRWWADVGPGCPVVPVRVAPEGPTWMFVPAGDRVLAFDPSRPLSTPRTVTVRGKFKGGKAGLRVWIGDRMVKTGKHGRFRATVRQRSVITVQMDPRDITGSSEPAVVLEGQAPQVTLTSYHDD